MVITFYQFYINGTKAWNKKSLAMNRGNTLNITNHVSIDVVEIDSKSNTKMKKKIDDAKVQKLDK